MTTAKPSIVSPKFFDADHRGAIDVMRKHWEGERRSILDEAKRKIRDEVRGEFCEAFGVKRTESSDDDGGGSISLVFPLGWTEDQAESFASNCLDLDLCSRYGGAGRYFQDGGCGTNDDGIVSIGMRWGMDI